MSDPGAQRGPTVTVTHDPVHLLFMCTANQCRSPMAAAIAEDLLRERNLPGTVASCGVLEGGAPATRGAQKAMRKRGLDLSAHTSRTVERALVDWATVVIAMEQRHLVEVAKLDQSALSRSFTLPELEDLARLVGPRLPGHRPADWVARCAAARDPSQAVGYSTRFDVPDPMGGPGRAYRKAAEDIERMLRSVLSMLYPS